MSNRLCIKKYYNKIMLKRVVLFLIFIIFLSPISQAEDYKLSAGVSVNEIPKAFFGSWRITAKLDDTNSYKTFKPQSADMWELSRIGDTVRLNNPFTRASAEISVHSVEGNLIVFSRKVPYDNKMLTDTVSIGFMIQNLRGLIPLL